MVLSVWTWQWRRNALNLIFWKPKLSLPQPCGKTWENLSKPIRILNGQVVGCHDDCCCFHDNDNCFHLWLDIKMGWVIVTSWRSQIPVLRPRNWSHCWRHLKFLVRLESRKSPYLDVGGTKSELSLAYGHEILATATTLVICTWNYQIKQLVHLSVFNVLLWPI